jgi:hypothetical protein
VLHSLLRRPLNDCVHQHATDPAVAVFGQDEDVADIAPPASAGPAGHGHAVVSLDVRHPDGSALELGDEEGPARSLGLPPFRKRPLKATVIDGAFGVLLVPGSPQTGDGADVCLGGNANGDGRTPTLRHVEDLRARGCTIVWSADRRVVEKRYDQLSWWFLDHRHDKFERERRVGMLLRRMPPPVPFARLLQADRRGRTLHFEAIDGEPFGPKFPLDLCDSDVDTLIELALAMRSYRPKAPFARRFDLARRVRRAVRTGVLDPDDGSALLAQAATDPPVLVFGHGDITARNVLKSTSGDPVLIDWEWAGLYPRGWDLAFLWFTVVDAPGARARVEAAVPPADEAWFWRSALLIQLLHLNLGGLGPGSEFRTKHEQMRDELVARVIGTVWEGSSPGQ